MLARSVVVLAVFGALASSCAGGTTQCTGGEDAGAALRTFGEPCGDRTVACEASLTCANVSLGMAQEQCVGTCGDGGACGNNTACYNGKCVPICSVAADCPGRFVSNCQPTDAGVGLCIALGCGQGSGTCPSGRCAQTFQYCCPPGAPCAAPPPGVCLK
ncbi:MAG: hypothetical protein U0228_14210 [Myxococcaceae bacterium]